MNRAELRREFPVEPLPTIVRADGSVSRNALRTWFSACGCPHANADVAVAVLKAGGSQNAALELAMLAHYRADRHGPAIECIERTTRAMIRAARREHAELWPWGKEAEDQAAAIEGRASRWGTADFHRFNQKPVRTNWYPCAPFGPVPS